MSNLSVDQISQKVEKLLPNKQDAIYVYCLSGSRSIVAVEQMIKLGYAKVFSVTSGLLA